MPAGPGDRRDRRDRREQGAIAVFVALLMSLIVLAASFAVDLGMQRVLRSDMQALADVTALDAARLLDGRTAGEVRAGDARHLSLSAVVDRSRLANAETVGDAPTLEATLVQTSVDALGAVVAVRDAGGVPVPVPDDAVPDAVLVTASSQVDFVFSALRGGASRTSVADATTFACFRVGSFAAALSSGDSAVAGVFEAMVQDALGINLTAVGYQGLLDTSVALGDLATELGVGTLEELVALEDVSVGTVFTAYAAVLGRDGDTVARAAVLEWAARVTSGLSVDVGSLLTVGDGSAVAGRLNAVDLLGSAVLGVRAVVADGNNLLATGVPWSVPGVGSGEVSLTVIEAPRQACGPIGTEASTAQVELAVEVDRFNVGPQLDVPGLGTFDMVGDDGSNAARLSISSSLAGATGTLVEAVCGAGTVADPEGIGVDVDTRAQSTRASMDLRLTSRIGTSATGTLLGAGVLDDLVSSLFSLTSTVTAVTVELDLRTLVRGTLEVAENQAASPTYYWVPPRDYTDVEPSDGSGVPVSIPTPGVTIDQAASTAYVEVTARPLLGGKASTVRTEVAMSDLDLDLGAITAAAAASSRLGTSVPQLVGNVNDALVPVSTLLGIRTAGADLLGVAPPRCGHPRLVG